MPTTKQYAALQRICLTDFGHWLVGEGMEASLSTMVQAPLLLVFLLRAYGLRLYKAGAPLYTYIYVLTAIQRFEPLIKHVMAVAWQVAWDWRQLEPTCHRMPMPMAIFKAMISLALQLNWTRFAGVTIIAFRGPGRIGEVLQALRKALVLPVDNLNEHTDRTFLNVIKPKTANRGGARVQHLTIRGTDNAKVLSASFSSLQGHELLYPFTPATYRARWDALLKMLKVPRASGFTPGGRRGGGAVRWGAVGPRG